MKKYELLHLDGDGRSFIIAAENAGKAKMHNFYNWHEVFGGTFREYISGLIYCRLYK